MTAPLAPPRAPLRTVLREWGRIGSIGFGGPPTHIALFRKLCVDQRRWIEASDFEDALAACNLLPGPASTQLAIYCAWRVRGRLGALVGGVAFIVPGLVLILALGTLFLSQSPPRWVLGAAAGAGSAVAAVAVQAGVGFLTPSWRRAALTNRTRWILYLTGGALAGAFVGPWLVFVLLACGAAELVAQRALPGTANVLGLGTLPILALRQGETGGILSLIWVALKVGALSYGGGFVIIPLMQHDAVSTYHWMTDAQFLNAVALGQITPGPVVQTIAVVGYAAGGLGSGFMAAVIAFFPSFAFILVGGDRFERLRRLRQARAFLDGAGPAAIGAILGSSVPLSRALSEPWQYAVLAGAVGALFALKRGVVTTLLLAAAVGAAVGVTGGPLPQ